MNGGEGGDRGYRVSTGHLLAGTGWLDVHFEACRPEYEAMLRSAGIERGWRVLDAGCGSGSYIPLIAELVGATGEVVAVDVAPENVAAVQARVDGWDLPCPTSVRVADLAMLPFADGAFDAVWCANVTQYFDEGALLGVLGGFRRAVRPGGLVAVKDVDMQLVRLFPADPFLLTHLNEVSVRRDDETVVQSRGSLRGRELRRWLERAGLVDVWQRTTLIERWAPLRPVERRLWGEWLAFLGGLAEERGVPEEDLAVWRSLRDPEATGGLLDDPEFYASEGHIVAAGRSPAGES